MRPQSGLEAAAGTIVPGLYPGRTRHIHVKLQAPGRRVVTTQLYFPGEPRNSTDTIFDARLLMNIRQAGPAREGTYDFMLGGQALEHGAEPGRLVPVVLHDPGPGAAAGARASLSTSWTQASS